ncbi:MAG TPA: hypothetical protein VM285_14440 [Polyangia bacterium]|nr:hypothetical protein [Polyangia bacterium]
MRIGHALITSLLGVALLALAASCDSSGGEPEWVGHWLRTRSLEVGNRVQVERWHLALEADGTFTEYHEESYDGNDLEQYPYEAIESREGTWREDGENLLLTGEWLEFGGGGIESLDDLASSLFGYSRSAMMIFAREGDLLFLGPDITHFTVWPHAESYSILYFETETNQLWRRSSVELTDSAGQVLQRIDERLELNVTGSSECTGNLLSVTTDESGTVEIDGPLTFCEVAVSDGVEIQDVGGSGTLTVQAVEFRYEAEGLGTLQREYFIQVGEHYLGYRPSEQAVALRNSAFVRVD